MKIRKILSSFLVFFLLMTTLTTIKVNAEYHVDDTTLLFERVYEEATEKHNSELFEYLQDYIKEEFDRAISLAAPMYANPGNYSVQEKSQMIEWLQYLIQLVDTYYLNILANEDPDYVVETFEIMTLPEQDTYYDGEYVNLQGGSIFAQTTSGEIYELLMVPEMIKAEPIKISDYPSKQIQINWAKTTTSFSVYVKRYSDVHPTHEFAPYIENMNSLGLMKGYSDGSLRFGIHQSITRAEFAAILTRFSSNIMGNVIPKASKAPFPDVSLNHWAVDEISFLASTGIIKGYESGLFKPNGRITRAEICVMLRRTSILQEAVFIKSFPDVPLGHWAYFEIGLLAFHGLVNGYQNGNFGPSHLATRGQIAKIINGFYFAYKNR